MRGNAQNTKVHYKGNTDDFVVMVESEQAVKEWLADRSIPLAQVVDGFKIFVTHKYVNQAQGQSQSCTNTFRHGSQGVMDTASKASLENEFGTKSEDEAIKLILEKGKAEQSSVCLRCPS